MGNRKVNREHQINSIEPWRPSAEKQAASSIDVRKELKDRLEREASQFGPQMVL